MFIEESGIKQVSYICTYVYVNHIKQFPAQSDFSNRLGTKLFYKIICGMFFTFLYGKAGYFLNIYPRKYICMYVYIFIICMCIYVTQEPNASKCQASDICQIDSSNNKGNCNLQQCHFTTIHLSADIYNNILACIYMYVHMYSWQLGNSLDSCMPLCHACLHLSTVFCCMCERSD